VHEFFHKLKQVTIGASPIIAIILAVHFFIMPIPDKFLTAFIISCVLLILGQALFLTGVDSSILSMGELVGSNIHKLKNIVVILLFGFLFGTMATVSEPAVTLVSENVHRINDHMNPTLLTWMISTGIGIFVAYGLLRIFKQFSMKWSFLIAYAFTFILLFCTPQEFQAVAFDFSGATTGVITVPFILALGVGVTVVLNKGKEDSYGMIGLASIGPIITMCIMGIIFGKSPAGVEHYPELEDPAFLHTLMICSKDIIIALIPIIIVFLIFNFAFLRLPKHRIAKMSIGMITTIIGLILLLTAVDYGFASAGRHIGTAFTSLETYAKFGTWFKYMLIPLGILLGFVITYTEPDIRVLANQVEANTNGHIKKSTLILTLAIGLGATVMFGMLRILFEINLLWFIIPIFIVAFLCMPFISKMFVGIGFDSGGVASGTITAAFFVPLAIGASEGLGGRSPMIYSFGMIALIVTIPMVTISMLGLIYALKLRGVNLRGARAVSTSSDQFIGIVLHPRLETAITEKLNELEGSVVTVFNAEGAQAGLFDFDERRRLFMVALMSGPNSVKMIDALENEFGYLKRGKGIAFTVPIDKLGY